MAEVTGAASFQRSKNIFGRLLGNKSPSSTTPISLPTNENKTNFNRNDRTSSPPSAKVNGSAGVISINKSNMPPPPSPHNNNTSNNNISQMVPTGTVDLNENLSVIKEKLEQEKKAREAEEMKRKLIQQQFNEQVKTDQKFKEEIEQLRDQVAYQSKEFKDWESSNSSKNEENKDPKDDKQLHTKVGNFNVQISKTNQQQKYKAMKSAKRPRSALTLDFNSMPPKRARNGSNGSIMEDVIEDSQNQEDVIDLHTELKKLKKQNYRYRSKLNNVKKALNTDYETEQMMEQKKLNDTISAALKIHLDPLNKQMEELNSLREENRLLKSQMTLSDSMNELNDGSGNSIKLKEQIDILQKELSFYKTNHNAKENELLLNLNLSRKEETRLNNELEESQKELMLVKTRNNELEQLYKTEKDESDSMKHELSILHSQLAALKEEREELHQDREKIEIEIASLKQTIEFGTKDNQELKEEIDKKEEKIGKLETLIQKPEIISQLSQATTSQQENSKLLAELNAEKEKNKKLEDYCKKMKRKLHSSGNYVKSFLSHLDGKQKEKASQEISSQDIKQNKEEPNSNNSQSQSTIPIVKEEIKEAEQPLIAEPLIADSSV